MDPKENPGLSDEIVDKFLEVYEALSNSAESSREMTDIKVQLAELIRVVSVNEVMKINGANLRKQQV